MRKTAISAVFSLACLFIADVVSAQSVLQSSRSFNGLTGGDDVFTAAAAAPGGGYYLAGYSSYAPTGYDIWLAKVDASLNLVASTTVNGTGNDYDAAFGVAVSSGGFVYVVGATSVAAFGMKPWLGLFSSNLLLISSATYEGGVAVAGDNNASFDGIVIEPGGTILVAGDGYPYPGAPWSTILLARYDSSLVVLGSATFSNGFASEYGSSLLRTSGGDIFVGGGIAPAALTSHDLWLGKFNSSLVLQASATHAGAAGQSDSARSLALGSNGDLYVAGAMINSGVTADIHLARYTTSLVRVSSRPISGVAATSEHAAAIAAGPSGVVIVGGSLSQSGQAQNLLLGEFYENGLTTKSSGTVSSAGANNDIGNAVLVDTAAGTALLAGYINGTGQDGWVGLFSIGAVSSAPAPSAPSGFAGTALSSNSIQWSWTDNASDETGYRVLSGTISISGDLAANATSWLQVGLASSTNYGPYAAQAFNSTGTANSATASQTTLSASSSSYAGCLVTANVGSGQAYATIQAGVDSLPTTLSGHSCVVIRDAATYNEQVYVRNFVNNGSSISIFTDPAAAARATVAPPASSTAAFVIANSSVCVFSLNVVASQNVPYGIAASSGYVFISSVSISTNSNIAGIYSAGLLLSSYSALSYPSVAVHSAHGVRLFSPAGADLISYSTIIARDPNVGAVYMLGVFGSTVTRSYVQNLRGAGIFLDTGSFGNVVSLSSAVSQASPRGALHMVAADNNTIDSSYFRNSIGPGVNLGTGSDYNMFTQVNSNAVGAGQAAMILNASLFNTITQSFARNGSGHGIYVSNNSAFNTVSFTTATGGGIYHGLNLTAVDSNTVSDCYIEHMGGRALRIDSNADWNTVQRSTIVSLSGSLGAVELSNTTGTWITASVISGGAYGLWLGTAHRSVVTASSISAVNAGSAGLYVQLTQSASFSGLYLSGSDALLLNNSTGTTVTSSILVATNTVGSALRTSGGIVGLTVASSTLLGPSLSAGIELSPGWSGTVSVGSVTVQGVVAGLRVSTGSTGFVLAVDSVTFSSLASGATAFNFIGGTFVSTINSVRFDTSIAVNVNASPLNTASRITMQSASGAKSGPSFENDPAGLVDWPGWVSTPTAPSGFAGVALSTSSLLWSWTDNASDETGYRVMSGTISLSGDLAAGATSWTQVGLASSTSYGPYFAQVFNTGGSTDSATASQTTLGISTPVAPSGFSGVALSTFSLRWFWTDNAANETGYRVMSGTISLSGDLAANATSWTQVGLASSTSYGPYFAQVFNSSGSADSATASQTTLGISTPVAPSGFAGTALSTYSILWSWTDNANNETGYRVMSGTLSLSGNLSVGATSWLQTGLTSSTAYGPYFAQVFNSSGTSDSPTASTVTAGIPPVPAAPTSFSGTALSPTAILWTWLDNATNETGYRVMSGTVNLSGDLSVSAASWTQTGLTPDTSYGPYFARAFNIGGASDSSSGTRRTLAAAPTATAVSSFTATVTTVTWSANGNPATTTAEVHRSTDNAAFALFYTSAATFMRDASLLGCTSYYYKVRHVNGDAVNTAFDATVLVRTADTVPAPPASLSAEAVAGGRIALGWVGSPTEGVTGYRLFADGGTGIFNFGAPLAVFTSTETTYTTGVLTSSAAYSFVLRAAHRCGTEETVGVSAAAASTATLASVRASIKNPDSGKRINGNSVTIMAELTAGTPSDVTQVRFQYRASTTAPWIDVPAANVNHPNPDLQAPYFTHWNVSIIAAGSYQLRAVARDLSGNDDPAPGAISVTVTAVAPDITENIVGGDIQKSQALNNAVTNTVATGGADANDPLTKVVLPPGALNSSTVTVTVEANPTITTAPPSGLTAVGSYLRIDLDNGQHNLSNGQTACITMSYPASGVDPSRLNIYSYDNAASRWTQDFTSSVNTSSRTITGCTPHFSIFAVFAGVATTTMLDSVRVYPNPYKPNSGDTDTGKPFHASDGTTGIIFDNLPAIVVIEIYSLTGRKVARFDTTASGGKIRWDSRNTDGRDVASGGYFAVISSPGLKSTVKKLLIIR